MEKSPTLSKSFFIIFSWIAVFCLIFWRWPISILTSLICLSNSLTLISFYFFTRSRKSRELTPVFLTYIYFFSFYSYWKRWVRSWVYNCYILGMFIFFLWTTIFLFRLSISLLIFLSNSLILMTKLWLWDIMAW